MARYIDADLLIENIAKIEDLRKLSTKTIGEAISNTPTADVVEVKQIEIVKEGLKWWLETNSKKGVVHIPNFYIENMIARMGGERKKNDFKE